MVCINLNGLVFIYFNNEIYELRSEKKQVSRCNQ